MDKAIVFKRKSLPKMSMTHTFSLISLRHLQRLMDLYYHTITKPDGKGYYEIDFLQSDGSKVSPIEVKSSGYKAHTSLDKFSEKYSSRIAHKYLVYTKDLKKDGDTLCVPIYMVPLLP